VTVTSWLSKIARELLHRGIFTSVPDLAKKIMRLIGKYDRSPKPVKWKHNDPSRRIAA